jgi:hypothetical protein
MFQPFSSPCLRATSSLLISPTYLKPSEDTSSPQLLRAAEASANACNSRIAALRPMCVYSSVVAAWLIRSVVDRS